jgi:hypothetical protein
MRTSVVVVGVSVGTGRASVPLSWRKSPKVMVNTTVNCIAGMSRVDKWMKGW